MRLVTMFLVIAGFAFLVLAMLEMVFGIGLSMAHATAAIGFGMTMIFFSLFTFLLSAYR